jgi:hypothetical protein
LLDRMKTSLPAQSRPQPPVNNSTSQNISRHIKSNIGNQSQQQVVTKRTRDYWKIRNNKCIWILHSSWIIHCEVCLQFLRVLHAGGWFVDPKRSTSNAVGHGQHLNSMKLKHVTTGVADTKESTACFVQ